MKTLVSLFWFPKPGTLHRKGQTYWLGCGVFVRGVAVFVGTVAMGSPGWGVRVQVAITGGMGLVKVKACDVQIVFPLASRATTCHLCSPPQGSDSAYWLRKISVVVKVTIAPPGGRISKR